MTKQVKPKKRPRARYVREDEVERLVEDAYCSGVNTGTNQ